MPKPKTLEKLIDELATGSRIVTIVVDPGNAVQVVAIGQSLDSVSGYLPTSSPTRESLEAGILPAGPATRAAVTQAIQRRSEQRENHGEIETETGT